jgi:hypothetical protein
MFGALSGKKKSLFFFKAIKLWFFFEGNSEIVRILLEAGAKTHQTNSIGRTAAQLAAFTGQKQCVDTINNYVTLDDLKYYTTKQGSECWFFCLDKLNQISVIENQIIQFIFHYRSWNRK